MHTHALLKGFIIRFLSTLGGGGGGGEEDCITSEKNICINGQIPTQASTSPHSGERLLNKLEICLTHHVSTEELLERADMKAISKLKRGEAAQMEDDWTVYSDRTKKRLQHTNDLGTIKKKKKRKTKNHLEAHS